jgi:hypothetical protein
MSAGQNCKDCTIQFLDMPQDELRGAAVDAAMAALGLV